MLSEKRQTSRSPTESAQTGSVRSGPTNRLISRQSQRSSITEEEENENVPPAPPLPQSFRTTTKSSSSSSTSSPTQSTLKPSTGSTNVTTTNNAMSFLRPTLRQENAEDNSRSARRNPNSTSTPSQSKQGITSLFGRVSARDIENEQPTSAPSPSKQGISSLFGRVSARDIENEKPTSIYIPQHQEAKPNLSVFEKVDSHGGSTTYLGSGTFPQLEDCIRNCLSQHKPLTDYTHHTIKYDLPRKSLSLASILDDYSYDGILSPYHHLSHCDSDYHRHHLSHWDSDHHHHHYYHHGSSYHLKHPSDLPLEEIRQVNDALSKYGIPVFSHPENPNNLNNRPRPVGDIISACQQLLTDPVLRAQRDGTGAVQHVWDNLHHHSPQTNMHGYASPAVRGVTSHLFGNTQNPYDPVHSAASHLFGNSQQSPYNPAPSAVSHLFGNLQQSPYNPAPSAAPNPYGNPQPNPYGNPQPNPYGNPQPNQPSAGQSALARLFGGSH